MNSFFVSGSATASWNETSRGLKLGLPVLVSSSLIRFLYICQALNKC